MFRTIAAALGLVVLLAPSVSASCPGITHDRTVGSTWTVHTFSGIMPDELEFEVSNISGGTTVEIYWDGSWHGVGAGTYDGTMVRLVTGGTAGILYRVGGCEDIIEPVED